MDDARQIFISVAEPSADAHAAHLVREARRRHPGWRFFGLTGPRLRAEGVETVFDFTQHAAMLSGILKVIGKGRAALAAAEQAWDEQRPDAVVVMDSSALHFAMGARAKKRQLRTMYYIAPQVWASRRYRLRRLAEDFDQVACILPFEEDYYRGHGINATFVGHPLFESIVADQVDAETVAGLRDTERPTIALLPGSRAGVVGTMLPKQLDVVRQLGRPVQIAVSAANADRATMIEQILAERDVAARIVTDTNASLISAADLVLVASGTATLHVAAYRKPMIVMYHAGGRWLAWPHRVAGRLVLKLPRLSLVNILAGRRVVPEFMPFILDSQPIAAMARALLDDVALRERQIAALEAVVGPLESTNASQRACDLLEALVHAGHAPDNGN